MLTAGNTLSTESLLSAAEEVELAQQIEAGLLAQEARHGGRSAGTASEQELLLLQQMGERARSRYIRANLRLVVTVARQAAARSRLPESDLFQEGCLGLISAVQRFDHRRGYRFSTYALFWIRAQVGAAAARSLGALNVPASRAAQLRSARGLEVELTQSLGRTPTTGEVATALGRSEKWMAELLAHQAPQSIDALHPDTLDLAAASEAWQEPVLENDHVGEELLWHLSGLERDVLAMRFGFRDGTAHSYAEISRTLALTSSKVRRLEQRALEALRGVCPSGAAGLS